MLDIEGAQAQRISGYVEKGIELLNQKLGPNWPHKIKADLVIIGFENEKKDTSNVLIPLFGRGNYHAGLQKLGIKKQDACEYGFALSESELPAWERDETIVLMGIWQKKIKELQRT